MRGYQPKFPVTPCQFPVNNVATLTGIVTAWLDLYRNGAHMQRIGFKYQKLIEILRFENLIKLRFRLD